MLPIIMAAPHAKSSIDGELRNRYALSDYEIWKCSDPYTGDLDEFTCPSFKHTADVNRLVCDYNRAPNAQDAFREKDFFGRDVFNTDQELTNAEKEDHLQKFWHPFHREIADSVLELDNGENDVILIVDYHNTAGDHALNQHHDYMPSFVLSNLGLEFTAEKDEHHPVISMPPEYVMHLKDVLQSELGIAVEVNTVYHGGYDLTWFAHLGDVLNTRAKIYSVQIEYNLDHIFNPISRVFDKDALSLMQVSLNESLISLYEAISAKEKQGQEVAAYYS